MIYELDKADFGKAQPLFRPLSYQPMCTAVLQGVYPGRVFVDDPGRPRTAFLNVWENWCFLVGDPENDAFNRALNHAVFNREVVGQGVLELLVTCHPDDWNGQFAVVSHPREPLTVRRRHYVCRQLKYDWRADLPVGFSVQPMDETLLKRPGLQLPAEVKETLARWRAIDHDQFQDFGFVAICENPTNGVAEVASWATVDFVSAGMGDVGLVTAAGYRRRGLAAVTTAAAVDHGLSIGLTLINWTTAGNNIGSIRTAEKLGFQRLQDYVMYYIVFDEAHHLAQSAYLKLLDRRYQDAVTLFDRLFALAEDPPAWAHYDAARAWAGLGNGVAAFERLNAAADRGWTDINGLESCTEFDKLRGTPQWTVVLERMRKTPQEPKAG